MALGESYADWIRKRFGALPRCPMAWPIPNRASRCANYWTWRTPTAGWSSRLRRHQRGRAPRLPVSDGPILSVNLTRMNRLLHLDKSSQLATFGAGTPGPLVEAHNCARTATRWAFSAVV